MANRENFNTGTSTGSTSGIGDWTNEDLYWRSNFAARPYTRADRGYETYQPGYRYGFESAQRFRGRKWEDVEPELRTGWDRYEFRGQSTWENVKDAVRDAWNRVTGKERDVQTDRGTARPTY
jgi:hypothetical protein